MITVSAVMEKMERKLFSGDALDCPGTDSERLHNKTWRLGLYEAKVMRFASWDGTCAPPWTHVVVVVACNVCLLPLALCFLQ